MKLQAKISEDNSTRSRNAEDMKASLEKERQALEEKFKKDQEELKQRMALEAKEREEKEREMNQKMEKSKESGRNEVIELFEKVRKELADRKKENEELKSLLDAENSKRIKESKDIADKLNKEQFELKDFIEKEYSDTEDIGASPNDIVFLFKSIKNENKRMRKEKDDLQKMLDRETKDLQCCLTEGDQKMKDMMEKEAEEVRRRLDDQDRLTRMKEEELARKMDEDGDRVRSLLEAVTVMRERVDRPVVAFTAVREEAYCTGGEEYLTFTRCTVNNGNNMDPKSGVFTATIAGDGLTNSVDLDLNINVCCQVATCSVLMCAPRT